MNTYHISINPFAEYLEATEARRINILKEQQDPDPVRIPYYQLAKARIKKSIALSGSFKPIDDGIKTLQARKPIKDWQKNDRTNSIIVLDKFKKMLLSDLIKENKLEIISPKQKHINFKGITINISPNIIFRVTIDGTKYIGACKIHISKGKPFSHKQSKLVANLIEQYLSNVVAEEDEVVDPVLCFCLDPFAGTTINSNSQAGYDMKLVKQLCSEIKQSINPTQIKGNVA
ncbi:MAG TPA: hypothetical protein VKG26_14330 [Bacteroidia bacterium]|nr:hypothetical protein [Bacteroidia bacterium]